MTINATKEVILSAGTIGSAQLLLLSGVGPTRELKKHNITQVAQLPVGKNLHDHVVIGGLVATTKTLIESQVLKSPAEYLRYAFKATGGFTLPPLVSFSFVNTSLASPDYPDVQVTFMAGSAADPEREPYETKVIGVKQEVYNKYYKPKAGQPTFNAVYLLNRPKSRGNLTLKTTNPHDSPLLDPNYLSHNDDITMAVDAAKATLQFMNTSALRKEYEVELWNISMPGCEGHELYSDEYLKCFVKQLTLSGYHFVGTCKMGNGTDAVVNHKLKVRGHIQNLRVVDASIMPSVVSGNIMATVYAIAAKASDMIIDEYKLGEIAG
ncbi:choline dehydrogenase, mitochondrial-like [Ornithodoros turicata]|uniref:choline dehydrogenase, mitochondrial-like n=1 Tax=Ornithodoros turicata TaxID=34597 RepID=UPI0031395E68